jgi:HD-GYP domain-containing protein (c-di-GMP phosphodiesterase class II)
VAQVDAFDALGSIRRAELLGALSHALDMTEGQPAGHCVRCCWIGVHIGRELGLDDEAIAALYYVLLLKDLGCSSNAARICQLYVTDDLDFKRDFKQIDDSLPKVLRFVLAHTGLNAGLAERFRAMVHIVRNGGEIARELIETRCQRGAEIARRMRFPEPVAEAILHLDEHWDGGGRPLGLSGEAISLYARIALVAQVVDVFNATMDAEQALAEVRRRSGTWFDPAVVAAFERAAARESFWETLTGPGIDEAVFALEPAHHVETVDDDYLDDIAAAFADVVDSKSPYTSGHSKRVALFTDQIAEALDLPRERRRWLNRTALLHDIGKLGVSNAVLDKPGKLDDEEWLSMRRHSAQSEVILSRIAAFGELARIAGAHHERLDGKGYPKGIAGDAICLDTRIISTADVFDALTADRPYRAAMPVSKALAIMEGDIGTALDGVCVAALRRSLALLEAASGGEEPFAEPVRDVAAA